MSLPEDNGELCARPSLDHEPAPPLFMISPSSDSDSFFDIYSFWQKILSILTLQHSLASLQRSLDIVDIMGGGIKIRIKDEN